MDRFIIVSLLVLITLGTTFMVFPSAGAAVFVVLVPTLIGIAVFRHYAEDKDFITWIFLSGLALRIAFGIFIHVYDLRGYFGGDANTYDFRGAALLSYWMGTGSLNDPLVALSVNTSGPGWGMNYLVASLYFLLGRNIFAAQSFVAVFGAAIAPMVYFCAENVFQNKRVAKTAAIMAAFFPAFIIWSGQLLKDGLIIFLLVLAMTMVLRLQEGLNISALVLLFLSVGGILTLRFYIFYMVAAAIAGSFIIGFSSSAQALVRNTLVLVVMALGMTYFGITRNATADFQKYGSLEQVQISRADLSRSAASGFGEDIDVSTTSGAISAIPIGLAYLMLAPFPWEVSNLRQAITLPEVLVWWAMVPFLCWGIWWAIKNKLRSAFPILIFSLMLTLAYSIFQGNVGTAYRQRTQIQVFLFIFIAVGWQLYKERQEDKKLIRRQRDMRLRQAVLR